MNAVVCDVCKTQTRSINGYDPKKRKIWLSGEFSKLCLEVDVRIRGWGFRFADSRIVDICDKCLVGLLVNHLRPTEQETEQQ